MIVDVLDNFSNYLHLHKKFGIVNEYLNNNNLKDMPVGKYEIDGTDVYLALQEYNSKPESGSKAESHKKYIDIQIVVEGIEKIGYTDKSNTKPCTFYDTEKDIEFLDGAVEFSVAKPGIFFIFYPKDAHMPSIAIDQPAFVKKAVFKVKID